MSDTPNPTPTDEIVAAADAADAGVTVAPIDGTLADADAAAGSEPPAGEGTRAPGMASADGVVDAPILAWQEVDGAIVALLPVAIDGHTQIRIDPSNAGGLHIASLGEAKHGRPVSPWTSAAHAKRHALVWLAMKLLTLADKSPEHAEVFERMAAKLAA